MLDRRYALRLLAGAALMSAQSPLLAAAARKELMVGDDGLYTQPWFLQTFLDLRDDLAEAAGEGKRLVLMWEQKGCPYCKETHEVNFARPEIHDYVKDNFSVLQLNLWGSREVTDFDGKALEERALARRWRVNFTPTIQFFPQSIEGSKGKTGVELEVARMPGYFKPFHFLSMFEFVKEEAYNTTNFQRYLQNKFAALKAKGIDPNVW
jgi:thioredoxin-related protein